MSEASSAKSVAGITKTITIPLQAASEDIWRTKYQLKDKNQRPIDKTQIDTFKRVAKALASVEEEKDRAFFEQKFLWALKNGAVPAGRILSNLGAEEHKPATSTINCTVSGAIHDSMDDILNKVHESGLTLKAGCGIGYEFSTLRPKGGYVSGAGAYTSGPLSFMDIYDKMCFTVSSAGGRRGAQMGTFDVGHPDVEEFIKAKREDGRLRQFNLSLLITDEFMEAVKNKSMWKLAFPITKKEALDDNLDLALETENGNIVWRSWPIKDEAHFDNDGLVACRVQKEVEAEKLWNLIMSSTYDFAEPGFILIDAVNRMNNNWFCEDIRATNPCGEQPLPPYGSCLLGSINLTHFVNNSFTEEAHFDYYKFNEIVAVFTRMLDNVVELNGLPLEGQRNEITRKRRHGMGFLGLGSALTMMCLKYGSEEAIEFTDRVTYRLAVEGISAGISLAKEKGPAPIMSEVFEVTSEMLRKRPLMASEGYQVGDSVTGATLTSYSNYLQRVFAHEPKLAEDFNTYGCRFTHHSSIAPTGTISLSIGNNASNGIEPSFAHHYFRNIIREGKKSKEKVPVYSFELLLYRELIDPKASPETGLPDYFVDSSSVTPKQHVDMQAAAQKWVDSAISKTANVPTDYPFEDFKDIYMYAYEKGLKGCTTFRFNPEVFQGVLVNEEDLKNTTYEFTLDDGTKVSLKGDEEIEYDGEVHTAANLFDALKEGYYGKF